MFPQIDIGWIDYTAITKTELSAEIGVPFTWNFE